MLPLTESAGILENTGIPVNASMKTVLQYSTKLRTLLSFRRSSSLTAGIIFNVIDPWDWAWEKEIFIYLLFLNFESTIRRQCKPFNFQFRSKCLSILLRTLTGKANLLFNFIIETIMMFHESFKTASSLLETHTDSNSLART